MNRKNVIEFLSKEAKKVNDPIIRSEYTFWKVTIKYEPDSLSSYLEHEKFLADNFFKNNSIVSKNKFRPGSAYSYLDVKKTSLVRKYVEILLKK